MNDVAARPALAARRRAIEAHLSLMLSGPDRAQELLDRPPRLEGLEISNERVRVAVARGDLDSARAVLGHWPDQPHPRARVVRALWAAVLASAEGDDTAAARHLSAVVPELEQEGQIAVVLDIGPPVLRPLLALYRVAPSPFLRRVIAHPRLAPEREADADRPMTEQLTSQETVILGYLPSWLSNSEIADQLGVSLNTIKTHLKHVYRKLGVTDRKQAIDIAERLGLL